ncbi:hypothetical protein CERZMDRAFT_103307 [Cercospora zeae-maydis SCOH1-5]|uniref:Uncharacterized protein n=1 Tax=Cercospora zeae-maydis SCOH1-5 TaxID=717836 RepID=A0A6A6EZQ9_9PEZI|nr:hypothetical protein CERZMDRAFT_103307 [Cercospora zeae-maydis SCOH1-5]
MREYDKLEEQCLPSQAKLLLDRIAFGTPADSVRHVGSKLYARRPLSFSNVNQFVAPQNMPTDSKRQQFEIVVTASDAPSSSNPSPTPSSPSSTPSSPSKGINAPKYNLGGKFFPGQFNPQVCSIYALLQNSINAQAGKSQCQMFNARYVHKNGWPFGTYCSLFSTYLNGDKWGTIGTTWSGNDQYQCKQSWTYSFNANFNAVSYIVGLAEGK